VNSGRKTRRFLVVAIIAVSVVVVAVPLCTSAACAESSSPMPAMPSHMSHSDVPLLLAIGGCDMAMTANSGLEGLLVPISTGLPSLLVGMLALVAAMALVPQWAPRSVAFLVRNLAPPGDLRGVRLLI
jgi:hypothetical protein